MIVWRNEMLYALIMAGGKGERFWPRSRAASPKQLLPITGTDPMIRQTIDRFHPLVPIERIVLSISAPIALTVRKMFPDVPARNILVEPSGRNTAPCIALAAAVLARRDPDAVMVIEAADHLIRQGARFRKVVSAAAKMAALNRVLVTVGIKPSYPETGYGYIHRGSRIDTVSGMDFFSVKDFKEKPDERTAKKYLEKGTYYWNSGMFVWSVETFLNELKQHMPTLHRGVLRIAGARNFKSELARTFPRLKKQSVDYGVLEKSSNVVTMEADFDWDDVGSWLALERIHKKDTHGNIAAGGKVVGVDSGGNIVDSTKLVALAGVNDLVVIETDDAILVCDKHRSQDVKKLVNLLRKKGHKKYL